MAIITYNCTGCKPIDSSIIDVYVQLLSLEQSASAAEDGRVAAEAARVQAESDRETAFTNDHNQAGSDHSTYVTDHNRASDDHDTAAADHNNAVADRNGYNLDHQTAVADHQTAANDHRLAGDDHTRADADHARFGGYETALAEDHARAVADHNTASLDHSQAGDDHTFASQDHNRAAADHSTAADDHTLAVSDHGTAGVDHTASTSATSAANSAATRANNAAAAAEHMVDIHTGPAGKSAYEVAVEEGYTGTEEEWLASLKGEQGNTGSSVDYPYELVNNLTTNDATKGLSAAQGVVLDGKLSQLEHKVSDVLIPMGQVVVSLFKKAAFLSNDAESDIHALESILSGNVDRIEAVYTQSGTVYAGEPLDDLKPDLVVTAYYLDGTSDIIDAYTLSGTLTAGTSTITVTFGVITTTFTVSVTAALYYRPGSEMMRPYFLNSSNANYGPAVVDGVTLVYTRSKNSGNVVQVSRACYPYFDLDLTKGTNYKWMVKLGGLPAGSKINVAVQYHNQAFKTDGLANHLANHSSDIMDSGWLTSTISDGILSFTYGSETASSALTLVGARLNLRLLDSSDNDIAWPDGSHIDALIIQTV